MQFDNKTLLQRIGLSYDGDINIASDDLLLTGGAADPESGLIVSVGSHTSFDDKGRVSDIKLKYWRQPPYGKSEKQNLITIKTKPAPGRGQVQIDQVWVQTQCLYDASRDDPNDPSIKRKVNTVLEGISRVNQHLRKKGPVEDIHAILDHPETGCDISNVTGEALIIRGLKREGGFDFSLSPYFMKSAGQGKGIVLRDLDVNMLKTVLGFRLNTMEKDKDFSSSREVPVFDTKSGTSYKSGVRLKETRGGAVSMSMYIEPEEGQDTLEAASIPNFLNLNLKPTQDKTGYEVDKAEFMGQGVEVTDTATLLRLIGVAQRANMDFSRWQYPTYWDNTYEFDLADMIDPLNEPPGEEEGGEFLYTSFHGSSFEKRIEEYGDQIGIADGFLHRVKKADGSISTVVALVDFPFASGGPNSNFDGAVPDYLPFWNDVEAILITHDHFDHCDGLAYYAKAGLMKEKNVYATPEVKYFLDKKMDFLRVPRSIRPKIQLIEGEGAFPIKDEDGLTRMWVQYNQNAVYHSARTTPYIVSGWYGDDKCVGDAVVYGDGRALTERGETFFQQGLRAIPEYAKQHGIEVDPGLVDRDVTTVFHDPTAIRYEGFSPNPDEVEENLADILSILNDKGVIMAPISTNDAEYTIGAKIAHRSGRDITAVGRNAELRLSCKNLFGMDSDIDLSEIRIDPFEEFAKPESERLIPTRVLNQYFGIFDDVEDFDPEDDKYEKELKKAQDKRLNEFKELLPPEERDHEKSTEKYMLESLAKHGAVVFNNDYNDYLRWLAIMEKKPESSIRATRGSKMAKGFRDDVGRLMIFTTGTQGNSEERFSTIQKFKDFFSLFDADEKVRSTGYKINAQDFVAMVTQPSIPGNEGNQELMLRQLAQQRDMTVIGAYMNGFKVYNLKDKAEEFKDLCQKKGWQYEIKDGNMWVKGVPIHMHGHGFRRDLMKIAQAIPAKHHEVHHIPDHDTYDVFGTLMSENGLHHSGNKPDDFQVYRIDANAEKKEDGFKKVAQLNPSYVLVRMHRKYGQFFNGWLELVRTTLMTHEAGQRTSGMMARTEKGGFHQSVSARQDWAKISSPETRSDRGRRRRVGPHQMDRGEREKPNVNRSMFSQTPKKFEP